MADNILTTVLEVSNISSYKSDLESGYVQPSIAAAAKVANAFSSGKSYPEVVPKPSKPDAALQNALNDVKKYEQSTLDIRRQNSVAIQNLKKAETVALDNEIKAQTRDFKRGLTDISNSFKEVGQSDSLFGAVFGGNLASNAISKITSEVVSGGKAVLDYKANLEQVTIGFERLEGSTESASKQIDRLQKFANDTPLTFAGLLPTAQRFEEIGFTGEKLLPVLTDIGNVVAGGVGKPGESLDTRLERVGLALKQTFDKNRVQMEELNQLSEAGVNGLLILEKATGKNRAELVKLVEQGQVTGDILLKSLQKVSRAEFGSALEKQSKTFNGALSTISDSLVTVAGKSFDPLFEKISGISVELAQEVNKGDKGLQEVGASIGKSIAKGFGETLRDELSREIEDIRNGKSDAFALVKANRDIGGAFQEGIFGKRGNFRSIKESADRLNGRELTDNLNVSDIQDLETVNFFGEFDEKIKRLKAERDKLLGDLAAPFAQFTNELNKGVDLNGVKVVFDPLTNTLKQLQTETKTLGTNFADSAKEARKLANATNKFKLSEVDNYLGFAKAKINTSNDSDISKIQQMAEIEQLALKEKIRLQKQYFDGEVRALSPEERGGNKGAELALQANSTVNALILQQEVSRLDANKQITEELEKQKKKVLEIYDKRIENDFAVFDLKERADELRKFKKPKIEDAEKFFKDFTAEGLKQAVAANGGSRIRYNSNIFTDKNGKQFTTGFTQTDLTDELSTTFERTGNGGYFRRPKSLADLTDKEKNDFINKDNLPFQQKLSRAFELANNRTTLNDDEKSAVDRKIISLSANVRPEQFTEQQLNLVASANEREAARKAKDDEKLRKDVENISKAFGKIVTDKGLNVLFGETPFLEVGVTVDGKKADPSKTGAARPTPNDTANSMNIPTTAGGGGLTNR